MFLTANLLIVGLFLGGVWLAVQNLLAHRSLKALLTLQGEEEWLFGSWLAPRRAAAGQLLFGVMLFALAIPATYLSSVYRIYRPVSCAVISDVCDILVGAAALLKVLFCTRYSLRQLAQGFCCCFILRWVYFNCHDIWFILCVLVIAAARDIDLKKALRTFFSASALGVGYVVLMYLTGSIPDSLPIRWGMHNAFGYTHYNTFGGLLLGLGIAYALLRGKRLCLWDGLGLSALGAMVFLVVGSRSSGIALCLLAMGVLLRKPLVALLPCSPIPLLLGLLPPALGSVFLLLPRFAILDENNWLIGPGWLAKIDRALSCRVLYTYNALQALSLRIAGQQVLDPQIRLNRTIDPLTGKRQSSYSTIIDSAYVHALYYFGPVVCLMLWGACMVLLVQLARRKRFVTALALVVLCVYALMETQFYHPCVNPLIVLFSFPLWGQPLPEDLP